MKRFLSIFLIGYLIAFFIVSPAMATNWYVNPDCAASCDGTTSDRGWTTFAGITWGTGGVVAGDTLYLIGGKSYTGPLNIGASGSVGSVITISKSGAGTATIDGTTTGINFSGKSYITIDGVDGDALAGDTTYGIKVQNIVNYGTCATLCVKSNPEPGRGIYDVVVYPDRPDSRV